jgi:hypothetical protein
MDSSEWIGPGRKVPQRSITISSGSGLVVGWDNGEYQEVGSVKIFTMYLNENTNFLRGLINNYVDNP